MAHYRYLILGGGMTADAAVRGIRQVDTAGSIGLISAESNPPYNRPPLTKGLWKGKALDTIWRKTDSQGAELHLGRLVQTLDPRNKQVTDDQGTVYTFDKLLLASGATPRRLPFGHDEVIYYRTVDDYRRLRALSDQGGRFAVIGGGFIGSEIAAALAMNGRQVVMVFPGEGIAGRIFPRELALFLNDYYRQKGVEVLAGGVFRLDAAKEERLSVYLRGAAFDPAARGFPAHDRCVDIEVSLGDGPGTAVVLGSDLSAEYVRENADYRS